VTPGSTIYATGTPLFPEIRFSLQNEKTFVVKARGVSDKNIYVQSATLNGKPYAKSYLDHRDLIAGGELVFEMGPRPNRSWGVGLGRMPESRMEGSGFVPVPVIKAASKTFRKPFPVAIQSLQRGARLYYTTDGSEPTSSSTRFVKPFVVDRDTTIKAIAFNGRDNSSFVVTAMFHRIPHDWNIVLLSACSSQYPGGGDAALIDGIRGTTNWSGGAWQGYWEKDLVAVVDLGKVQRISRVGAGFLQDVGSWIWLPRRVDFEVSVDGKSFTPVASITPAQTEETIANLTRSIAPQNARFVRLRATNSGKNTWIFADEILIEN
jgi:hypothetical protein